MTDPVLWWVKDNEQIWLAEPDSQGFVQVTYWLLAQLLTDAGWEPQWPKVSEKPAQGQ